MSELFFLVLASAEYCMKSCTLDLHIYAAEVGVRQETQNKKRHASGAFIKWTIKYKASWSVSIHYIAIIRNIALATAAINTGNA